MRLASFGFLILIGVAANSARADGPSPFPGEVAPVLAKYCAGCHGPAKAKGGFNLASYPDEAALRKDLKAWQKVLDQVEGGAMPPEGAPKPTDGESGRVVAYLQAVLSKANCSIAQDPGRVTLRRLNREEYNNTVRDLVGVDFRPADDFPSDDVGYGFDNIGDVLSLPPLLMEKYLAAAEAIAEAAILADETPRGATHVWRAASLAKPGDAGHEDDSGSFLMYSSAEVGVEAFPKGGNYIVRARAFGQQAGDEPAKLALRFEGKDLKIFEVKAEKDSPAVYETTVKLRKGGRLTAAFINDAYFPDNPDPNRRDRNLGIDTLEVVGPMYRFPHDLPESHKRILFRKATRTNHREVAQEVLARFATRAFRRPASPAEVARLVGLVEGSEKDGDRFEKGIQLAIEAVLTSPHFLFRVELETRPGGPRTLTDLELASRLSYFLWSSMPDDELLDLATRGQLRLGKNLDAQVARMLKDGKARALVENFSGQWLQTRKLAQANPDRGRFEGFDEPLRQAMRREVEMFVGAVVKDDRPISDFLHADYTFLNERLAKHYKIPNVAGDQFRRVALTDRTRGGVVTMASTLTVTSNPTRTSPVKRGKWILEEILGTPPPAPPPGIADLGDDDDNDPKTAPPSLRARLEKHRSDASCASCHARMDPLGFGLENFDAVGSFRTKDGGSPVDPSGVLPGGQSFVGPVELKAVLLTRIGPFSKCLTEKLMTYALGRGLEYPDRCIVEKLAEATLADGGKFSRLVSGIVHSDPFQKRGIEGSAGP